MGDKVDRFPVLTLLFANVGYVNEVRHQPQALAVRGGEWRQM